MKSLPAQLLNFFLRHPVLPQDCLGVLQRQLPQVSISAGDRPLWLSVLLLLVCRLVWDLHVAEPLLGRACGIGGTCQLEQTLALHSLHVGSGGVPGGALDLFIHLQLVVVHVLLCKDEAGAFLLFMPHYFQDLRILIS